MNLHLIVILTLLHFVNSQEKETEEDEAIEIEGDETEDLDTYDETDKKWVKDAVQTVAYYLRSHKFNNFDRRYFGKPSSSNDSNLFGKFVEPPLRYFHWSVFEYCKDNFYSCLRYLYETTLDAYLQRSIDTVYVVRKNNLSFMDDGDKIENIEKECNRLKELDFQKADPFGGPIEKFQWCITASYYMCWYTMLETPELRHFDEPCDNFANCLQNDKALSNKDVRADDSIDFHCAMYSFCPDPCCKDKRLLDSIDGCLQSDGNPCRYFNDPTCSFNKTLNRSLLSMVYNEWNVSCVCIARGYRWNSRYGLCIDYNECKYDNPCDVETEECVNVNQRYICRCKLQYKWSSKEKKCVQEEVLVKALKRFSGIDVDTDDDGCYCTRAQAHLYYALGVYLLIKYNHQCWI